MSVDALDAALLRLFAEHPRIGVLEASRQLGVARGTVQARLTRLERSGAVAAWGPAIDAAAIGYPVTAFVTLEIRQGGGHDPVGEHLAAIPEVIEAHTVTGPGDAQLRPAAVPLDLHATYLSGGGASQLPVKVRATVEPRTLSFHGSCIWRNRRPQMSRCTTAALGSV